MVSIRRADLLSFCRLRAVQLLGLADRFTLRQGDSIASFLVSFQRVSSECRVRDFLEVWNSCWKPPSVEGGVNSVTQFRLYRLFRLQKMHLFLNKLKLLVGPGPFRTSFPLECFRHALSISPVAPLLQVDDETSKSSYRQARFAKETSDQAAAGGATGISPDECD